MAPGPAQSQALDVDGRARTYLVTPPSRRDAPSGVLFALHHSRSRGRAMRAIVGPVLEPLAERDNVAVVYPDGYGGHFNDCRRSASYSARRLNIDDVAFMRRIVEHLSQERPIDLARVAALGYSNGGQMALRLALEAPDLVCGVVAVAAHLPTADNRDCAPAPAPARRVAFVAGTKDPINPYAGGPVTIFGFGHRGEVLSAQDSAQWFADQRGLAALGQSEPFVPSGRVTVRQQDWRSSEGHVQLITLDGGGHTVPQAHHRFRRILGPAYADDAVLRSNWSFLFAQPIPS